MKLNKKAFKILTPDEQASLALQKVHGKSSWEAGGIINRSHYKYLEIKQRAERFFELFTVHYDTFDRLIPEDIEAQLSEEFSAYLKQTIEKRQTIKKAIANMEKPELAQKKARDAAFVKDILRLRKSTSVIAQNFYSLIMEFDRYNNFRILPTEVQEPSAFKRRNKTRFRRHLTLSTSIHPYSLMRIKQLFEWTKGPKPKLFGYIALANYTGENFAEEVIRINATDSVLKTLSSFSVYVFPTEEQANEYIELVRGYIADPYKDPKKGLKFWPNFRVLIKESFNYDELNNITPTRKGLMSALKDLDDGFRNRRKEAKENDLYN